MPQRCAAPPLDTRPALAAGVPTRLSQLAHEHIILLHNAHLGSFPRLRRMAAAAVPLPCAAPPSDTRPALAADVPTRSSQLAHVRTPWCRTLFLFVLFGAFVSNMA